jgi:hypothetical protein
MRARKKKAGGKSDLALLRIRPGYGAESIHTGQSEAAVREYWGPPAKIAKFDNAYFYVYRQFGFDVDFGRRGGTVRHINFFAEGVSGHRGANVALSEGLTLGQPLARVIELKGEPVEHLQAIVSSDGSFNGEALVYADGVFFQAGPDGRIVEITISDPSVWPAQASDPQSSSHSSQ